MKKKNQNASPPENDKSLTKHDAWELEEPDEAQYSLEALLEWVNTALAANKEIGEVLHRRLLLGANHTTDQILMKDEEYSDYALNRYRMATSKGHSPAIGIKHVLSDVWDAIYLITRSPEIFGGKASRLVGIVETCMIHVGLYGLDRLLAGRPKVVQKRKAAIWKGGKEKRLSLEPRQYKFVSFTNTKEKQQNIYCLSPQDFARAATISEDYDWSMGFVVQMAMVIAIASSEKLPDNLREEAKEEVRFFEQYLNSFYYISRGNGLMR